MKNKYLPLNTTSDEPIGHCEINFLFYFMCT